MVVLSYPLRFALPGVALGGPRVALESAPLKGHRMTFGRSSKDPLRPLSQVDKEGESGKIFISSDFSDFSDKS